MTSTEKGLNRGGVEVQEGELSNHIALEGSIGADQGKQQREQGQQQRDVPAGAPLKRARNPFMDQESQDLFDREPQRKRDGD